MCRVDSICSCSVGDEGEIIIVTINVDNIEQKVLVLLVAL